MENATLEKMNEREPVRAAQLIIGELLEVREKIKAVAEGFAVLDFVQGHVATELPADTALDIIDVIRGERAPHSVGHANELVMFWLENYRRAYSLMIMRVLEEGADSKA